MELVLSHGNVFRSVIAPCIKIDRTSLKFMSHLQGTNNVLLLKKIGTKL